MARIRTIKPSLWDSEKIGRLQDFARLTFIGLISIADDEAAASRASVKAHK